MNADRYEILYVGNNTHIIADKDRDLFVVGTYTDYDECCKAFDKLQMQDRTDSSE